MKEYDAKSTVATNSVAEKQGKKSANHARLIIRDFSWKAIENDDMPFVELSASAKLQILGQYISGVGVSVVFDDDHLDLKSWINFFDIFQSKVSIWMKQHHMIPYRAGFKSEMQTAGMDEIFQRIVDMLKGLVKAFNDRMNAAIRAVENAKDACYRCHPPTYKRIKQEREKRRIAAATVGAEESQKAKMKALAAEDAAFEEAMKKADEEDTKKNAELDEKSKADAKKKDAAIRAAALVDIATNKKEAIEQSILTTQERHTKQKELVYQMNADYEKNATKMWSLSDLKIATLEEMTAKQAAVESARTQEENLSKVLLTSKENSQKVSSQQQERLRKQLAVKEQELSQKSFHQEKESENKAAASKSISADERGRKLLLFSTEINAKNVKQEDKRKWNEQLKREEEQSAKERTLKSVVHDSERELVKEAQKGAGLVQNVKKLLLSTEALVNKAKCEIHDAATRLVRQSNYMTVIASQGTRMFFSQPCGANDPKCRTASWAANNVTEQYALFTHRAARLLESIESFKCDRVFELSDSKASLAHASILAVKSLPVSHCGVYAWSSLKGQKEQRWNKLPNTTAPDGSCIKSIGFSSAGRMLGVLSDGGGLVSKQSNAMHSECQSVKMDDKAPKLVSVMGRTIDGSILGLSQQGALFEALNLEAKWRPVPLGSRIGSKGDVDTTINLVSVARGPGTFLYGIRKEDGCLYQDETAMDQVTGNKLPNNWRIVRTTTYHDGICKMKSVSFMHSAVGIGELKLTGWDHYMYSISVSPVGPDDITEPSFKPSLPGCWYRSLSGCPERPGSTLWQELSLEDAITMTKQGHMAEISQKRKAAADQNEAKQSAAVTASTANELLAKNEDVKRARDLLSRKQAAEAHEAKNKELAKGMVALESELAHANSSQAKSDISLRIKGLSERIRDAELALVEDSADIYSAEDDWVEGEDEGIDDGKSIIHMLPMKRNAMGINEPHCTVCPDLNICAWLSSKNVRTDVEASFIVGPKVGNSPGYTCHKIGTQPEVVQNKRDGTMYVVERTQPSKPRCMASVRALTMKCFGSEKGDIEVRHNEPDVERIDPKHERESKTNESRRMERAKSNILKRQKASIKRIQEQGVKEASTKKGLEDAEKAAKAKVKDENLRKEKIMKADNALVLSKAEKAGKAGEKEAMAVATNATKELEAKFDVVQKALELEEKKQKDEAKVKKNAARAIAQAEVDKKIKESKSKQSEVDHQFQVTTKEQQAKVTALDYGRRHPTKGFIAQDMNVWCNARELYRGKKGRGNCANMANHYRGHCNGHRCWFMHVPHDNLCIVYQNCLSKTGRWNTRDWHAGYLWEKVNLLLMLPQERETFDTDLVKPSVLVESGDSNSTENSTGTQDATKSDLEKGLSYKLGPLVKKKGSCCVDMVTFNDLPRGEILQANLRHQIKSFTEMWRNVLAAKSDMISVREMATVGNHYTIMLKNVGANGFFDLLGDTSRKVVRDAETIEAYSNLLIEKFNSNWPSIRAAVIENPVSPVDGVHSSSKET